MISGVNHITLAVSDLQRSIDFYQNLLGGTLTASWDRGAYLDMGGLWLCLSVEQAVTIRQDDTHLAFSCNEADYETLAASLRTSVKQWKENTSEGQSLYFLDPDGHKLELHVGDMASRLSHYQAHPEKGVTVHKT